MLEVSHPCPSESPVHSLMIERVASGCRCSWLLLLRVQWIGVVVHCIGSEISDFQMPTKLDIYLTDDI